MILTEKETAAVKDLQQQEQTCIEKYQRYSCEAKDTVLKDLFKTLQTRNRNILIHFNRYLEVLFHHATAMILTAKITTQRHPTIR